MNELVHIEHVFVANAKKEELHTELRLLYENGTVCMYREYESLLLMIPSKEIVEVELDSRRGRAYKTPCYFCGWSWRGDVYKRL